MTRDEHRTLINSLLGMVNPEHQAEASEALNNLSTDYDATLEQLETANNNVTTLTERNEHLRAVNSDLFMQVPAKKKPEKNEPEKGNDDEPPSFDALFNEKGELI